jgi:hypothetical protein
MTSMFAFTSDRFKSAGSQALCHTEWGYLKPHGASESSSRERSRRERFRRQSGADSGYAAVPQVRVARRPAVKDANSARWRALGFFACPIPLPQLPPPILSFFQTR